MKSSSKKKRTRAQKATFSDEEFTVSIIWQGAQRREMNGKHIELKAEFVQLEME